MARNLTYDHILAMRRADMQAAVDAVPEFETVTAHVPVVDPKTNKPKVDAEGFAILAEKKLLKRDVVRAQWADKIKPDEDRAHDRY